MKNLQLMLTGREVSKAENKKGLSQATTLTPDKVSTTARLWLDYGSSTARVLKYAAMLLMVLTLGVGEMNAYTLYFYIGRQTGWRDASAVFKLNSSDADGGTTLTRVESTDWYSCSTTATSKMYIVRCNPSGGKWNSFSFTPSSTNNVVRLTDWNAGELFSMYVTGDSWNSLGNWDNANANGKMTITATNTFSKTFTDVAASQHEFKVVEQGRWDYSVGTGGTITTKNCTQGGSGNIQFTPYIETGSTTITYNISSGEITITCPKIPITLNKGTDGTSAGSATVDVGASTLSTITHATKTDWNLTGYWTASSGGYKVINADGTFVSYSSNVSTYLNNATPSTWKKTSATTLYAQWNQSFPVTYNANGGSGTMTDASSPYSTGATVTVKTNTFTRDGYTFTGWNTSAEGDGTPYANGATFTISAATTLYAQWSENKSTVSLVASPTGAGTFTSGSAVTSVLAGVATKPAVTAVPVPGYKFTSWAVTGGATISSTSTNPTTVTGKGAGAAATLTATFDRKYAFIEGRFNVYNAARTSETHTGSSDADWSESSTNIAMDYDGTNHRFYRHTYKTPAELKAQKSGYDQWFSIKTSTTNGALSGTITTYHPSSNTDLTATGVGNKKTAQTSTTTSNYKFNNSTTTGYVILYFDEAGVWYELEHTLEYNGNGNTSGNVPASKTYYNNGASATVLGNVAGTPLAKTGYNFSKWNTKANGSGTDKTAGSSLTMTANTTLYAQWTAKEYTITLDKQTSATGYGASGTASNPTATYNAVLPAISGTMPSATGNYGFMGFYTEENGGGERLTDADGVWIASVDGYTDADKKWIHDGAVTLYAYYKTAEITELTFVNAIVSPSTTVQVTPTIEPTPAGTTHIDWRVLYSNGTALPSQPEMSVYNTTGVQFAAPASSATYKVEAVLRTGSTPGAGTTIHTKTETFQVAGDHTVTVLYKCDDMTIQASTEVTGSPLEWSDDITAPSITGYTFSSWTAGDGVTIKDGESSTTTTHIKATYDGTLTANYTRKRMIYFYNTLDWENVYVYFYKDGNYWDGSKGTGTDPSYYSGSHNEDHKGQMLPIAEGSEIYYFDAEGASIPAGYTNVAFTEKAQDNCWYFYDNNKVIRRGDYKSATMPMFVPLADQEAVNKNSNTAKYYSNGYWMNYPENSGYTLKIYNGPYDNNATGAAREISFPYSADLKLPLKVDVEFNNGEDVWFMVYRRDGTHMGLNYEMNQNYNDEQPLTSDNDKLKIVTSAPGVYTFTLTYHDNGSGTLNYYIDVDFPVAVGDYRIVYKDNASWSHGAHDGLWNANSWKLASDVIRKATTEAKNDTVSFYVAKGAGITAAMKFQYVSAINASTGVVTWTDVDGGGITIPSATVTKAGVYNFIVSQPIGGASISLEKAEPYTGNYYIRTDCAGNTKWDSYKTLDHQMTYSDYAAANAGYTHYFCHWVTTGTNVKFCIANDYSLCISDTLVADYGTTIAGINASGNLTSANANIRFMWNEATNVLSRAYIGGSGTITDRFLVLEGDAKMYDENGNALTGTYQDHDKSGVYLGTDNQVIMHDDENFVYERTIQVNATARARLSAKYNSKTQYFIGSSGDFGTSTTEEMLGGTYNAEKKYSMRIVYDFKTNRLVRAYIPSGTIDTKLEIHADIMLVREHQEAGQQLTFSGSGALSDVKTVYGVMRFNRYTLNNKNVTAPHGVVADPKSSYERGLYWISFPFDVNLSDVFGFGSYGTHWIIMEYDGAERASTGYWADSQGFWKHVTNRSNKTLEAGKGYVLALDLDLMRDNDDTFWKNDIEQVELFFPSAENVEDITKTSIDITVPEHECTITARPGQSDDRTKKDSHWNIIGVPSYANYSSTLTDGSSTIEWQTGDDLPYLYEWNSVDNTYTAQSGTTYPFKAMHSYMVQYHGTLHWTDVSATPASPVAARYAEAPKNTEFRLELQQNAEMTDQTFVKMTNDEAITANFDFNKDLCKEMNKGKANIYTMVEGYIQTAGNCLPMREQTTIVPVGVKIAANDDYTFSIPDGTNGVGVTLIDQETGVRTNLSALDYTVSLEAGTYNERFVLEISPIQQVITNTELINGENGDASLNGARKQLIDGLLYIIRDGKMYDARGARVE